MRRALLIGIDHYAEDALRGCVADAFALANLLETNGGGSPNFDCKVLASTEPAQAAAGVAAERLPSAEQVEAAISRLFATDADVSLLFFAGHGARTDDGGAALVAADDGLVPIKRILELARGRPVRQRVFVFDSCFAGGAAADNLLRGISALDENTVILTACGPAEQASESGGRGLFTSLVCAALSGGAADVRGRVTAAGVYAFVDPILNAWQQRPLLKANVGTFTSLRRCAPLLSDEQLRQLPAVFQRDGDVHPLNPSYEPESGHAPRDFANEAKFAYFQALRDAGLLKPAGATSLYHAAMESRACKLTPLGRYYWHLAARRRL